MGLVLACLGLKASAATADGFRADLTLAGRFDERPSGSTQPEWVGSMTPRIGFTREAALARYDAEIRRRFDSLDGDVSPRPANDVAKLDCSAAPSQTMDWALAGNYYRSRDPLDQDPRVTVAQGTTQTAWGRARLSAWRGEASYEIRNYDHTAPQLSDAWSQSAAATIFPVRTPQGAWLVRGAYQEWNVEDERALSAVIGTTGYRRQHAEHLSSEIQVGAVSQRTPQEGTMDPELAWSVGVEGLAAAVGLPLGSRLRVGRDVETAGVAELWRDVGGLKLTAEYRRAIESEGGRFSTPAIKDFASLGMENSRLPFTLSIEGAYGRSRPRVGEGETIETMRATGGLSRALNPWLTGRASYSYLLQRNDGATEFQRNRAELALTAQLH
jgi:hypothetical protein